MHVLFLTPAFPPFIGGGERYARSLALALAAQGLQITVVTSQAQHERQLWLGTARSVITPQNDGPLTVIRCPVRPFPGGWRGLLLWRKAMVLISLMPGDHSALLSTMARRVPSVTGIEQALACVPSLPTLLHGFNLSWERMLLVGRDYAQRRGLPMVVTPFAHFGAGQRARVARNATMDHQRALLNQAQAVLTLTAVEREGFANWNMHPRKVLVVGGGVDDPPAVENAAAVVAGLDVQAPFALFVGRANRDKGAIHAAQATQQLAQNGSPLTFVVAGQITDEFQRFYGSLSDAEQARLHLLGPVDETTKHALLEQATMLLLPSQAESFGIVLLEAWQHGTPVIGANAGGIRGVVEDGHNGLLVPFGDVSALAWAMQKLLHDEILRRNLGRRGQEKVRREYRWDRVAERVHGVYREVLA